MTAQLIRQFKHHLRITGEVCLNGNGIFILRPEMRDNELVDKNMANCLMERSLDYWAVYYRVISKKLCCILKWSCAAWNMKAVFVVEQYLFSTDHNSIQGSWLCRITTMLHDVLLDRLPIGFRKFIIVALEQERRDAKFLSEGCADLSIGYDDLGVPYHC